MSRQVFMPIISDEDLMADLLTAHGEPIPAFVMAITKAGTLHPVLSLPNETALTKLAALGKNLTAQAGS
jgi:hypothetical protein